MYCVPSLFDRRVAKMRALCYGCTLDGGSGCGNMLFGPGVQLTDEMKAQNEGRSSYASITNTGVQVDLGEVSAALQSFSL